MKNINTAIIKFDNLMEEHISNHKYQGGFFPDFPTINEAGNIQFRFKEYFNATADGLIHLPILEKELNSIRALIEFKKIVMTFEGFVFLENGSNDMRISFTYGFFYDEDGIFTPRELEDLTDNDIEEVRKNIFEALKSIYQEKLTDIVQCYKKAMKLNDEITYSFKYLNI